MHWLTSIDRRWIFLAMAIVVVGAFAIPIDVKLTPSKTVKAVHDKIENLRPTVEGRDRAIILFSLDYDPSSKPELDPMARAMIRHAVTKGHRVLAMTHWPTGIATTKRVFGEALAEFDEVTVGYTVFDTKKEAKAELEAIGKHLKAIDKDRDAFTAWVAGEASSAGDHDAELTDFAKRALGAELAATKALAVAASRRSVALVGAIWPLYGNAAVVIPGRRKVLARTNNASAPDNDLTVTNEVHRALAATEAGTFVAAKLQDGRHAVFHVVHREKTLVDGDDYCYLGYKPGLEILMISMGQSLYESFPTDLQGRNTRSLRILRDLPNLKKLDYLVTLAAGDTGEKWVSYGGERFGFPVSVGCTAVMAPDLFPYLQAKQIDGMVGGIRGAWEYEALTGFPGEATKAVAPQTAAHLLIILLIALCNVGYFLSRNKN